MSVEVANQLRCHCRKCIDFHTHFLQREVFETSHPHSVSSCFGQNMLSPDLPSFKRMFEPQLQIEDMDIRGIDMNVLTSCDVVQSRAWATPDDERRMTALVNEECARWVDAYPNRFIGTTVLPIGDMKLALAELNWAAAAGFKIVQLPSNYRGDYLGHARFTELWAALDEAGLVAFIHPEEVKCMSSLIYEGIMDRFPNLKIVMAHGGGYVPHYMGRLDRNVNDKPFTTKNISKKPSEYLKDFYYDSCVYDPRTLELLVERVGIDRVVLGGDYPVASLDPIDFLNATALSQVDCAQIAGGNVDRLLGLT